MGRTLEFIFPPITLRNVLGMEIRRWENGVVILICEFISQGKKFTLQICGG